MSLTLCFTWTRYSKERVENLTTRLAEDFGASSLPPPGAGSLSVVSSITLFGLPWPPHLPLCAERSSLYSLPGFPVFQALVKGPWPAQKEVRQCAFAALWLSHQLGPCLSPQVTESLNVNILESRVSIKQYFSIRNCCEIKPAYYEYFPPDLAGPLYLYLQPLCGSNFLWKNIAHN